LLPWVLLLCVTFSLILAGCLLEKRQSYQVVAIIPDIMKALKGVSARLLMKEYGIIIKKKLWGGHLWNPSYFVATVSENTEEQILNYINSQKEK
jgi:REP element-mobilizing transposase RayT